MQEEEKKKNQLRVNRIFCKAKLQPQKFYILFKELEISNIST